MPLRPVGLLAALLAVTSGLACSSKSSDGGGGSASPMPGMAYRTEPFLVTAQCPYGGIQVLMGIDDNGNSVLDAAEVDAIEEICNGAPGAQGATSLIRSTSEPAGANCTNGGIRIDSGIDADGSGTLDATEVASTEYVCGTAGTPGADGIASLLRVQTEPAGANCSAGGVRVQSGPDLNRNGALDSGEVTSSAYVCNGTGGSGTGGMLETAITGGPARNTAASEATFWFSGTAATGFRCSLDGSAPAPCASPKSYSSLGNGTHAFEVAAVDASGQADLTPAVYAWTVDITPPEVTVTSAPPPYLASAFASVSFTVNEASARVSCSIDQETWAPCTSPWNSASLAEGPHELGIAAVDTVGNVDPTPARVAFTVDTLDPITFVDLSPPSPTPPAVMVAFHSNELATFTCALDGAPVVACTSPYSLAALGDGSHTLVVTATDLAANADHAPPSITFTVDGRVPQTTVTARPPAVATLRTATVTFTSDVVGSNFTCVLDGAQPAPCNSPLVLTGLADGPHQLSVRATSLAGLADPTPAIVAWTVDATPPETAFTLTPPEVTSETSADFQFLASESGGTFSCAIDGAAPAPCTSPLSLLGLSRAMHSLRVAAIDVAGNADPTPATFFWTVQQSALFETTITGGPASPSREASVGIFFTGQAAVSFLCRLDGSGAIPCTSPFTASSLANGPHTFEVAGVDGLGVPDATPATLTWVVDTLPPVASIVSGPEESSPSAFSTFEFSSNEPQATFLCALDGGPAAPCPTPWTTPALTDDWHWVQVWAVDATGNISVDAAYREWRVDTTPPAAVLSGSWADSARGSAWVRVRSDEAGSGSALLDGVADLCSVNVYSTDYWASPPYASIDVNCDGLSDGTHTITVVATDLAGNPSDPVDFTFTIDRAPVVTFTEAPPPQTPSSDATIAFTADKPSTFECSVGGISAPCVSPLVLSGLGEGWHWVAVYATSGTGVMGYGQAEWRVDTTPPDTLFCHSTFPVGGVTSQTSATVHVYANESPATFVCAIDGTPTPCSDGYATATGLVEGPHTFTATATDALGLVDPTPLTIAWTVGTPPVVTITEAPPPHTSSTDATISFTADNPVTFTCSLDAAPAGPCTSPLGLTGLGEGSHSLWVFGTTGASLTGSDSVQWRVDTTPPETYLSYSTVSSGGLSNDGTATFQVAANETPVTFECVMDGVDVPCSGGFAFIADVTEGPHTFTAAATDGVGLVDLTPLTVSWTTDLTPPDAPVFVATPDWTQIRVSWSPVVDAQYYRVTFGTEAANPTIYVAGNPSSTSMTFYNGYRSGYGYQSIQGCTHYYVTVVAYDAAGC